MNNCAQGTYVEGRRAFAGIWRGIPCWMNACSQVKIQWTQIWISWSVRLTVGSCCCKKRVKKEEKNQQSQDFASEILGEKKWELTLCFFPAFFSSSHTKSGTFIPRPPLCGEEAKKAQKSVVPVHKRSFLSFPVPPPRICCTYLARRREQRSHWCDPLSICSVRRLFWLILSALSVLFRLPQNRSEFVRPRPAQPTASASDEPRTDHEQVGGARGHR